MDARADNCRLNIFVKVRCDSRKEISQKKAADFGEHRPLSCSRL